jgi:hypothetical protein
MTILNILSLVLGGIPLLVYPMVFLAGIMSLAGERSGGEGFGLVVVSNAFLLGSMAYPAVWIFALVSSFRAKRLKLEKHHSWITALPLIYLFGLFLLFNLWSALEA